MIPTRKQRSTDGDGLFWHEVRDTAARRDMGDLPPASGSSPRLLDRVRQAIRLRHYSRRTEQAYIGWIRRFIVFHGKRHPRELGEREVTAFLSRLATRGVSASTQNQALSAILFLYEVVVGGRLPWMNDIVRAQRPTRLPVVLSREEVTLLLGQLRGPVWLMASLMYGAGLRLLECAQLRVKDLHFDRGELTIRGGKGGKDRATMLPATLKVPLRDHLARVKTQHDSDLASDAGASPYRARCEGSIPTLRGNGPGSGCFPQPGSTSIRRPVSAGAITCTNPSCSGRSRIRSRLPPSVGRPPVTRYGIPLPRICSKRATTSARSRSYSGTGM